MMVQRIQTSLEQLAEPWSQYSNSSLSTWSASMEMNIQPL